MGLKHGFAAIAAQRDMFVCLNANGGHPYLLAQVRATPEGLFRLVYPDGSTGILHMGMDRQLELEKVIPNKVPGWTPNHEQRLALLGQLPKERIMFDGSYEVGEVTNTYLPPDAIHETDEARFKEPNGVWEQCVAECLMREPPLVLT